MSFLVALLLVAQAPVGAARDTVRPTIHAARVARPVMIDGRLDDEAWIAANPVTTFRQVEPTDGAAPSERTEVRVLHDADALYIGARLFDARPSGIVARLGRRDAGTNSDLFSVAIDSYHDHRTAFRFDVNAAGVKGDELLSDDNASGDVSWDPVWEAATRIDSLGWTTEIRIPFSQLRFTESSFETWGIDFSRYIQRAAETVRWSWAPRTEAGYASLFGHLSGLIEMARATGHRAEIMPYVVTQRDRESGIEAANPFHLDSRRRASVGADFKYGITSGFTLTGTLNPDFGQVEADPAEVNLTVFETYFTERRPFFVEGANLFRFNPSAFGAPQLFYSRRIGRPPAGRLPADTRFYDLPEVTSIHGAAKVSGKLGAWSLAALDAVTAEEHADVMSASGGGSSVLVEPRANYGVLSVRRDFRSGRSGVGMLGTGMTRQIPTPSLVFLRSSAYTGGMDFFHRFGRNRFSVTGTVSASRIAGEPAAISLAQRSSARYFQRPDQDYMRLDSTRRVLGGYNGSLSMGKVTGDWLYGYDFFATSPGFEINDLGFQTAADRVFAGLRLTRRWTRATRYLSNAAAFLNTSRQWNFGGTPLSNGIYTGGSILLRNNWFVYGNANYQFAVYGDRALRGGPLALIPSQWTTNGGIMSDSRKALTVNVYGNAVRNKSGGYGNDVSVLIGVRPTAAVDISGGPTFSERHSAAGFIASYRDPTATTTFGTRYILAGQHQRTLDLTARANVSLSSNLSLQCYTQPFVSSVLFSGFKAAAHPAKFTFIEYGKDGASTLAYDTASRAFRADPDGAGPAPARVFGNPDFSLRSLRTNVVLRWEYRRGSTLYLAWAHGREGLDPIGSFDAGRDLRALATDDQRNRLLIKASYWFNP